MVTRQFVRIPVTIKAARPNEPEFRSVRVKILEATGHDSELPSGETDEDGEHENGHRNGRKYISVSTALQTEAGTHAVEQEVVSQVAGYARSLEGLDRLKFLLKAIRKAQKLVGLV